MIINSSCSFASFSVQNYFFYRANCVEAPDAVLAPEAPLASVISWILERLLSFLFIEFKRIKYFCAWEATCVGVRETTKFREIDLQSPFPNLANPRRNKRCSSSVHGMPFLLSCSCVSCCLEPPVLPAVTCVPPDADDFVAPPPSEDFFFCTPLPLPFFLFFVSLLDGDPGTLNCTSLFKLPSELLGSLDVSPNCASWNSLPHHGLVISSQLPPTWLFGTLARPLSIARISSTNWLYLFLIPSGVFVICEIWPQMLIWFPAPIPFCGDKSFIACALMDKGTELSNCANECSNKLSSSGVQWSKNSFDCCWFCKDGRPWRLSNDDNLCFELFYEWWNKNVISELFV